MFPTRSRPIRTLAAVMTLVITAGCMLPGAPTTLSELPPELEAVFEDPASFQADPDDPLSDVVPGAVIDNLAGLTGCWGVFAPADPLGGNSPAGFYEVYAFDSATGTVTRWGCTTGLLGIPPVLAIDEGRFTRLDEGRIEIRLERFTIVDLRTGLGREFTDVPTEVAVIEKLVTLDDDRLLVAAPTDLDGHGDPAGRVFTRFACPE